MAPLDVFNYYLDAFKYFMDALMSKMMFAAVLPLGWLLLSICAFSIVIRFLIGRFK